MGRGVTLKGRNRDGSTFPVDISPSSIETNDGLPISVAIRDITDRVALELLFDLRRRGLRYDEAVHAANIRWAA